MSGDDLLHKLDQAEAIGAESAQADAVRIVAKALVELAAPVWVWGDGNGGWVHQLIDDQAATIGILRPPPPPSKKRATSKAVTQLRIFRRDRFTCQQCTVVGGDLTVDHIIPVTAGGTDDDENLQTLCRSCNSTKGTRHPEDPRSG